MGHPLESTDRESHSISIYIVCHFVGHNGVVVAFTRSSRSTTHSAAAAGCVSLIRDSIFVCACSRFTSESIWRERDFDFFAAQTSQQE